MTAYDGYGQTETEHADYEAEGYTARALRIRLRKQDAEIAALREMLRDRSIEIEDLQEEIDDLLSRVGYLEELHEVGNTLRNRNLLP